MLGGFTQLNKKAQALVFGTMLLLLSGCGNTPNFKVAESTDGFAQNVVYNTKVDILWVVDNSSSMGKHQERLTQQFNSFISSLESSKFDFNIAVTTTDVGSGGAKGSFVGNVKVLNRSTPDLRGNFISNVLVGENGSTLERGLSAMKLALSPEKLSTVNQGFLRSDALLAVVVLSDEEDFSEGTTESYEQWLNETKPAFENGGRGWIFNSIVVPEINGSCKTYNEYASPGYRYIKLSESSRGLVESICTPDFGAAVKNLRARIIEILTEFHLKSEPDVSSIHVYVNGVELPNDPVNGWTYEPKGYTIKFHGLGVPPADARVQISYRWSGN